MRYLKVLTSFIAAEISAIIAIEVARNSPLSLYIPYEYLYLIMLIPVVMMAVRRNPYDFTFLAVLILLMTPKTLSNSKIIYSLSNALYFFGFRRISEGIASVFSAYKGPVLGQVVDVVVLFTVAQVVWYSEDRHVIVSLSASAVIGILIAALLPAIPSIPNGTPIILGLIGLVTLVLAVYLLLS